MSDMTNADATTGGTDAGLSREMRDRRIAVARDVIERIDAAALKVTVGNYIGHPPSSTHDEDVAFNKRIASAGDLRDILPDVEAHCEVCARGGLLLSKARIFDAVPAHRLLSKYQTLRVNQRDTTDLLSDTFDAETLEAIESAFEQGEIEDSSLAMDRDDFQAMVATRRLERFVRYGISLSGHDTERLRAICSRIVDCDGEFLLPPEFAGSST
jgi:hypothetical protein